MDLPGAFTITASSSGPRAEEQAEHPQRAAQDAPPHGRFYKSRKARPCDACRRRKVVCHMPSSPPCQRCSGKAISCTFKQAPDKKKRPAPRLSPPSQPALFSPIGQRPLWHDDATFFSLNSGNTPETIDSSSNVPHQSHDGTAMERTPMPPWHHIASSRFMAAESPRTLMRILSGPMSNEVSSLPIDFSWDAYESPRHIIPRDPHDNQNSPLQAHGRNEHSPVNSMSADRSITSRHTTSPPVVHQQEPTVPSNTSSVEEEFTTDGSLEILPGAFSFFIGPTGVSDSLLLQREPYNSDGLVKASVRGLQYRCLKRAGNDQDSVFFGITDHSLLEKADGVAESSSLNKSWSEFWTLVDVGNAWSLLQLYGRFVHPYFPIVSPQQIPTKAELLSSSSSLSPPTVSDNGTLSLALLSAMSAAALPFIVHDRSLYALLLRPPSSEHLYRLCWQRISQELHAPTLSTLQSCLLLQQRLPTNLYLHDTAFSWSLMSTSVSVAQTLGLHRDPSNWASVPAWERRLRRRLWWALWTTETWVALARGMPRHLSRYGDDEDSDVDPLKQQDMATSDTFLMNGEEGSRIPVNSENQQSLFLLHLVGLTAILADIQHSFYTLKSTKKTSHNLELSMEIGKPLHGRLQSWRDALPHCLRFRSSSTQFTINSILAPDPHLQTQQRTNHSDGGSSDRTSTNIEHLPQHLDGNASLHLSYIVTHMMLFRALLRPLHNQEWKPEDGTLFISTDTASDARNKAATRGALLCVREFVEFVEALTPNHWNAFWHGWSRANFSMAGSFIVYLLQVVTVRTEGDGMGPTSGIHSRPGFSDEFRELLSWIRRWRWASRVSINGAAGAKGLTNLMLLRVETFLGELGDFVELKDHS